MTPVLHSIWAPGGLPLKAELDAVLILASSDVARRAGIFQMSMIFLF
jgi:hypothetical protein